MEKEKPVIFQGTGYRVIRSDKRNLALEIQNKEGGYSFKGYFQTIEQALSSLVRSEFLLDGSEEKRTLIVYLKEVRQTKETIVNDIKNYFKNSSDVEDLDEYDLLG